MTWQRVEPDNPQPKYLLQCATFEIELYLHADGLYYARLTTIDNGVFCNVWHNCRFEAANDDAAKIMVQQQVEIYLENQYHLAKSRYEAIEKHNRAFLEKPAI